MIDRLIEDIKSFSLKNTDEKKVLRSHCFSAYKGVLVLRLNIRRSFSFGLIGLGRNVSSLPYAEEELRHEYGHFLQLKKMGIVRYIMYIARPSVKIWGKGYYYLQPWERDADIRAGVDSTARCTRHDYRPATSENDIKAGEYMDMILSPSSVRKEASAKFYDNK